MSPTEPVKPITAAAPKTVATLHEVVLALKPTEIEPMRQEILKRQVTPEHFASAYSKVAAASGPHAATFAAAYTRTIQTQEQLSRAFSIVAQAPAADRKAILIANRDNENGAVVVHAASTLPAAHARVLMQDFLTDGANVHEGAASSVAEWFMMAGEVLLSNRINVPGPNAPHDWFGSDLWNDAKKVASGFVQGVKTIADAVGNAVGDFVKGIGHALSAAAKWTLDQVKNLVHGIFSAGKSLADVLRAAFNAGYEALKKIVQGVIALG